MKKILTKQKSKWAENRSTTLRGTPLAYNAAQQLRYQQALGKLVRQMTSETKNQILKLFNGELADDYFDQQEEAAAMDASIASKAKKLMNKLTRKFQLLFALKAQPLAESMINGASQASKTGLHASLQQLSGGLSLKTGVVPAGMEDVAKASISENVSLIKSIPSQYFTDVTGSVMRSITTGNGLADLVPAISKYNGQTERRAKNLALDQTRKAYNSINKQRMQALGVKQFKWVHSGGGQHPRPDHVAMNGNVYSFDDLPVIDQRTGERGIPGQAINCRCTMTPVIVLDDGTVV